MKFKSKVTFRLEQRKDKMTGEIVKDNVPIILDFSFDGKRLQYYTGYRIDANKWDANSQSVVKNNINKAGATSREINNHFVDLESTITKIYQEAKIFEKRPSVQYIRDQLKKRMNEDSSAQNSFIEVFQEFLDLEQKKRDWTSGTITKLNTILSQLKEFQKKKHYKIEFDSIDDNFYIKYVEFQRETLGHRNTTIKKNLYIFNWFMNWATKKKYNTNFTYKDCLPDLKGTDREGKIIILDWDELMNLHHLEIGKDYLERVRDVFCFCCFTGLRYSDVQNLKRSNIKENQIEITSIKTDDDLIIDLNDHSKAILAKYKDAPFENDKCLPVISNQKMNDYLKELGKIAGLKSPETIVYYKGSERFEETFEKWQLLSTHSGRKTFVTNAIFLNIPSEIIQKWTGHKDHKVFEKYYKIIDKKKRTEMKKFNRSKPKKSNSK
ncbi:MAG: tyrosine-type recombinase/integrase [Bacteroidota bacterium]